MNPAPRVQTVVNVSAAAAIGGVLAVLVVAVTRTITHPGLVDVTVVLITGLGALAAVTLTSPSNARSQDVVPSQQLPAHHNAANPPPSQNATPPPRHPRHPPQQQGAGHPLQVAPLATPMPWHEAAALGVAGQVNNMTRQHSTPAPRTTERGTASEHNKASDPTPTPPPPDIQPATAARASSTVIPVRQPSAGQPAIQQIVQCPRCADFGISAHPLRHELRFDCSACGHAWHWRPTDPWPITVVRPTLAREQPPARSGPTTWRMKE